MNVVKWNQLYQNNKRLDDIFVNKYKDDNKLFEKNCIELLVEISEFINETKVFKYWTTKKPNKEKMLEEYADVITMILTFYHELNIDIKEYNYIIEEKDLLKLFNEIYVITLDFIKNNLKEDLEKLFVYTLYIGKLLKFNEKEIINSIENKQKIIENRLNSDY